MTLNIGTVLNNRYRIAKLVGQGGFGAVYRAWDLSLLQPVALKENSGGGADAQRQFEREAQLLAGLRHSNLPRVIDHFVLSGQGQYLVMDFVEGKSLSDLLAERGGPLGEAEVLPWIRQVADALEYLHTSTPPIIHRDIKPDNIIITDKGRAMLVDFGISKVYDSGASTTVGARAVTPGYSPPEQYGRGRTDARSDVYALGATLYTLLTGQVPPDGPDLASGADTLIPPRQVNRVVSETTSAAVVAAMMPNISQRLGSAAEFEQLLPTGGAQMPASAPVMPRPAADTTPMPVPLGGDAKRVAVPLWGWAVGVLALIALAVWAGVTFGGRGLASETPEATQVVGHIGETATAQAAVESMATSEPNAAPAPTGTAGPVVVADAATQPTQTTRPLPTATPTSEPSRTTTLTPEPLPTVTATLRPGATPIAQAVEVSLDDTTVTFEKWLECSIEGEQTWGCEIELWSVRVDGTDLHRLTQGNRSEGPAWSPDGRRIAFALHDEDGRDVAIMEGDVTVPQEVTAGSSALFPQWLNNDEILFSSPTGAETEFSDRWRLHVVSVADGTARMLDIGLAPVFSPAVSHDRSRVAVNANEGGIYLYSFADSRTESIDVSSSIQGDVFPHSWYPNGRFLVAQGGGSCYKIDVEMAIIVPLLDVEECNISWSSDGKQAVYQWNSSIWIMRADGQSKRPLVEPDDGSILKNPVWGP